jgi:hypothetical protein
MKRFVLFVFVALLSLIARQAIAQTWEMLDGSVHKIIGPTENGFTVEYSQPMMTRQGRNIQGQRHYSQYNIADKTYSDIYFPEEPIVSSGKIAVVSQRGTSWQQRNFIYYDGYTGSSTQITIEGVLSITGIDSDYVCGVLKPYNGIKSSFLWNKQTGETKIVEFPGAKSTLLQKYEVKTGKMAGGYNDASGCHGFYFDQTGYHSIDMKPVNGLPAPKATIANDILGDKVIGYWTETSGRKHGFIYYISTAKWMNIDIPDASHTEVEYFSKENTSTVAGRCVIKHKMLIFVIKL